jgi:serralysin
MPEVRAEVRPEPDVFCPGGVYRVDGELTNLDARDRVRTGSFHKLYTLKLTAGRAYTIHLASNRFDAFLRLEDAGGTQLAQDDDSGGGLNSQIVYRPQQTGFYRIIATSLGGGSTGNFTLTVRQN